MFPVNSDGKINILWGKKPPVTTNPCLLISFTVTRFGLCIKSGHRAEQGTQEKLSCRIPYIILHSVYLESFEMWCWRRMEKISWTNRVKNEEVLHRVKEERNILRTIKRRKANWICHIFV
jgi:hypothetical protein